MGRKKLSPSTRNMLLGFASHIPTAGVTAGMIALATVAAQANPTGGTVTSGHATITAPNGSTVDINQSSGKAVINWQSFGIGSGETVNFVQPTATSVTLNRVVGGDLSAIFGTLNANGIVMLVNPNGVVFGRGSHVDVGGLVATTANIKDSDFKAGRYTFGQASANPNAAIVNAGDISIKDSGLAALVAPSVRNSGVIRAKLGRVELAGAKTFTVDFHGDGLLSFDASSAVAEMPRGADGKPAKALVVNSGQISAEGGTVALTARAVKGVIDHAINTSGVIAATSVGKVNGHIVLSGGESGDVEMSGTVDASGKAAGETGGTVAVTGHDIQLADNSRIDASGAAGGGSIALGSGQTPGRVPAQGGKPTGKWSDSVSVGTGATLVADATVKGNGGSVSVLSEKNTKFAGQISARGGKKGGNGGTAEVSSHANVNLTGHVVLTAAKGGKTGRFLLDPDTLEITDDNTAVNQDNVVSRGWLEAQSADADIELQATGLITIDAMAGKVIDLATASGNSFTLSSTETGGIVFVDPATEIRTQGGSITLEALGAGSTLSNIGKLTTNGGDVTLIADGNIGLANAIDAGGGAVYAESTSGSISATPGSTVSGWYVALNAGGSIGSAAAPIATSTQQLVLQSGGDIVVGNDQELTELDIYNNHAIPGVANTLSITAPSLAFSASDDGSHYTLNTVSAPALEYFSFSGDQGIAVGKVAIAADGAVNLSAETGDIVGDGNPGDTISAGNVNVIASAGGIGSSGAPLATDTANLVVSTAGDLYVANAQTLAYLDIASAHASPTDVFAFQVTAPGLTFDATDSEAGYNLTALANTDGSSISFTGDRSIALGNVNLGPNGSLGLYIWGDSGSITGNGDSAATVQAGSIALFAPDAIGASDAPLALVTGNLSAGTNNGGVYVAVPSTLSSDTTVTTIGGVDAGGPVVITAAQGDLDVQRIYSQTSDVTVTASNGLVTNSGYIYAGGPGSDATGAITLASGTSVVTGTGSLGTEIYTFDPGGPIKTPIGPIYATNGTPGPGSVEKGGITTLPGLTNVSQPAQGTADASTSGTVARATTLYTASGTVTPTVVNAAPALISVGAYGTVLCGSAATVAAGPGKTIVLSNDAPQSPLKAAACGLGASLSFTGDQLLSVRPDDKGTSKPASSKDAPEKISLSTMSGLPSGY